MNYRDFMKQAATGCAKPIKLETGITQGFIKSKPIKGPFDLPKREQLGRDYALKYRLQEEQKQEEEEANQLEELEGLTSIAGTLPNPDDVFSEQLSQVYDIYSFNHKVEGSNLLVQNYKEEILENIESNAVILIKGPTGCGKSTQVPQMILDNAAQANIHCNIVVTQPRRIATMSIAKRVAQERNWGIGTIVGYQISLDKKLSPDTRLLYCTTGVLLQQLITQQSLSRYTHIIVDEIHERDMETDFLLILIKMFLKNPSCRTKVILMSATVITDQFIEYFSRRIRGIVIEPPVVEMSKGSTNHPVSIYYLDDLKTGNMPMKIPDVRYEEPMITYSMYELAASLVEVFHTIDKHEHKNTFLGSVLIFLPGMHEIEDMYDCLMKRKFSRKQGDENWWIKPLHSFITWDEQVSVFQQPPPNHRKIILATNIAESSITVPDVKYVIDFCLMKYLRHEADSGYSSLQMAWMSKSQGTQRAGRVGRVMPGRTYRLIPNFLFDILDDECEPEITRSTLDVLVLKSKQLAPDSPPAKVLAFAMDPPDLSNIHRTILKLKQTGALTLEVNGEYVEDDGELTYVGEVMAALPINIASSKLILMGHKFSLLKDAIVLACAMEVRSIFSTPFRKQLEAYNSKIGWADSSCSDLIAFKIAYEVWRKKKADGFFDRSGGLKEKDIAERYFIQVKSLKELSYMEQEITNRLQRLNIVEQINSSVRWNDMEKPLILKIMLAGAFYPNYFLRRAVDEKEAVKILGGRDPFSTCYLTGFPMNQPGPLYAETIKNHFTHCGSGINVTFDGSSKAYLEFKSSATDIDSFDKPAMMPGYIQMALYRAIKLRQLKRVISVPLLQYHDANNRWASMLKAKESGNKDAVNEYATKVKSHLPGCTTEIMAVNICHKDNPSRFWVQIADEAFQKRLVHLFTEINDENKPCLIPLTKELQIGMLVAAPYSDNKKGPPKYFRAKIRNFGCGNAVQVFFIDYGNNEWIDAKNLRDFHQRLIDLNFTEDPEIAMECTLTEVQPSVMSNRNGLWSDNAVLEFDKYFGYNAYPSVLAKIYSVVNGVVSVVLFKNYGPNSQMSFDFKDSFNYHLIKNGYADRCEEAYLSRQNHILREEATKRPDLAQAFTDTSSYEDPNYCKSPNKSECVENVVLRGPKSPLEMQLFCVTQKCMHKGITIDPNSVNSVLLDTYPMDPHERMLVAGMVNQSANGERLILRQTTLMPNIHGLFAIIALIFSPYVELRVDSERSRWTGALCGLGYDPMTHESYDPENDMEVNFDVSFTLEDLENINRLRYWMNLIIFGGMTWQKEMFKGHISIAQEKIKDLLTKILLKKRPSQGVMGHGDNFKWGLVDDKWLLSPMEDDEPTKPSLYPLIWAVRLKKSSSASNAEIAQSLDKLNDIINGVEKLRMSSVCELCHVYLDDVQSVKFHVSSSMHREALLEYKNNASSNN